MSRHQRRSYSSGQVPPEWSLPLRATRNKQAREWVNSLIILALKKMQGAPGDSRNSRIAKES